MYRSLPVASDPPVDNFTYFSLTRKPGKRRKTIFARRLRTRWRNSRSIRGDRFETCEASNGISRNTPPARYSSSWRPLSYGFAAAIVSKHHTHASVNICAHARMFVPPAFVVKARWHDAAVIDVRDKVPSRWLQKLISDVAGVSNTTAIDSEYRRGREIVTLNLSCEYWFKIQSYYLDVLLKISCLTHTQTNALSWCTHERIKLIKSKFCFLSNFFSTSLFF